MADVTVVVRGATFRYFSPGSIGATDGSVLHLEVQCGREEPRRFDARVFQQSSMDFRDTEVRLPPDLPSEWDLETLKRCARAYFRDVVEPQFLPRGAAFYSGTLPQTEDFDEVKLFSFRMTPDGCEWLREH